MNRVSRFFALGVLGLFASGISSASLIGDSVDVTWLFPDGGTVFASQTVSVVSPGAEISCPGGAAGGGVCAGFLVSSVFQIEASSIQLTHISGSSSYNAAAFNGFLFSSLDFGAGTSLTGFSLVTNLAGIDNSRVSFDASSIRINLQGAPATPDTFFRLDLTFGPTGVPEPSTWVLFAVGLGGVVARQYRARRIR